MLIFKQLCFNLIFLFILFIKCNECAFTKKNTLYFMKFYLVPRNYYNPYNVAIKGIFMADCSYKNLHHRKIESLYIEVNNTLYKGITDDIKFFLCSSRPGHSCTMWPHRINFNIPWDVAQNLDEIKLVNKKTGNKRIFKLDKTAAMSEPYDGITVCAPVLYYYNNWLQIFLFLEKWREQGNANVVIYYKSLSKDVYGLLKYYESIKLVTLIPAPDFKRNDPNRLRSPTSFFISHLYFDDCMYGRNMKYAAVMDVDEYFYNFNNNNTVLDLVKEYSKLHPTKTFFNFESIYMSYVNHKISDSFKFGTTVTLLKDTINKKGKSVTLMDRNEYIGYHYPLDRLNIIGKNHSKNFDYHLGYRFPRKKAILLHARPNYVLKKFDNADKVVILKESERLHLLKNYKYIKNNLKFDFPMKYKETVIEPLETCLKKNEEKMIKNHVCGKNYDYCHNKLKKLEDWVYAENDKNYYGLTQFN